MSTELRVVVVGAGRMGEAIIAGLVASGWPAEAIVVVEAHQPRAEEVGQRYGVAVLPPAEAVVGAAVGVVAVTPHARPAGWAAVAGHLAPGATVVSVAAGVGTAAVARHVPKGTPVVRAMPNTPALVGEGMSVLSPAPGCPAESLDLAERVLGAVGQVRRVDEAAQDAVTAISGSGPAYVFYVAEAMIDAGVLLGLPRPLSRDLAVQTLVGAAAMLRDTGEHATVLRENVTSPGGTTAAALQVLDDAAVKAAFARAMQACHDRSAELAGH